MAQTIKDGETGNTAGVDKNSRLQTFAINRTVSEQSVQDSGAYNINSGLVTLTTAGESGIIYFKNNENIDFDVDSIVVTLGPSTGGSATDTTRMRVYKNPTTGTLISGATAVDVNSNRDFGSSDTLQNSLAYKGAEGNTITDGSVHIESLISPGNRVVFNISEVLRKGNSIAVSLEPNDSNTSMKVMVAIVAHQTVSTAKH
jgi:hypothetical protein